MEELQMMHSIKLFILEMLVGSALLLQGGIPSYSQTTAQPNEDVQGWVGSAQVAPNPDLHQTVVVFTSTTPISQSSNQIVFVLHSEQTLFPKAWSGDAQILISRGFVAVVPKNHNDGAINVAFRFPEQPVPATIKDWTLDTYDVYGISRYGEMTPLTPDQITELETTGKYTKVSTPSLDAAIERLQAPQLGSALSSPSPDGPAPICQSGGKGSSSCSGGGCSVTCKVGFTACCTGGACNCY